MADVAYKTGVTASGQGSTVTLSAAGVSAGDVQVVQVVSGAGFPVPPTPSGWTLLQTLALGSGNTGHRRTIFWRRDAGTFSATGTDINNWTAQLVVYSGCATSGTPFTAGLATAVSATAPSVNITASTLAVRLFSAANSSPASFTLPATARQYQVRSFFAGGISDTVASPPSTGTSTMTAVVANNGYAADTLALIPANTAPNAPILADVGAIDRAVTNRFPWTFSDPDPGDSQSKFDLRYRLIGAPSWTDVTGTTPNQFWDAPPGTFVAGDFEWQARTYDSSGVVGPYASSSFFTAGTAPPSPTITDPINGATIGLASYTAVISAPDVDASQWRTVADNAGTADPGTVYSDSGVLEGPVRAYTFSFPVNNRTEHLQSRIRDALLWSQWADSRNPISYTPPPDPTAVKASVPADGAIDLTITNPAPGAGEPTVAYNDIFYAEPGEAEERKATLVAPNSTWRHWLPASDAVYTYRIVSVASNGTTSEVTVS